MKRNDPYIEVLRRRRLRKKLKRLHRQRRARAGLRAPVVLGRGQRDPLLDFLRQHFKAKSIAETDGSDHSFLVRIPEVFSFTDNPGPTMNVIYSVLDVSTRRDARSLRFDHSKCVQMDLGASTVLDVVILRLRREWRARGGPYNFGGTYPEEARVRYLFQCMGMTKHLRVRGAEAPEEFKSEVIPFELFLGDRNTSRKLLGGSDQELAATRLVQYLCKCFEKAGYKLNIHGQRHVVKWVGEIITNAEEHSGRNEWFSIGYMLPPNRSDDGDSPEHLIGECQLVIFNFGKTIFESIIDPNTPQGTRDEISQLAATHSRKKFFFAESFTQADLCTLYALQDGVSRFSVRPGASSRGKGTVQMINAFQQLGSSAGHSQPRMTLLSGRTRILFDPKYRLQPVRVPGGVRNIIAFNDQNDLEEKPDPANVHMISGTFPGALLSFKFFMDRSFLKKLSKNELEVSL